MFSKVRFLVVIASLLAFAACNNQFMSSGIIYMQQNDFDKAIVQFNEAAKVEPNNAQAYLWLGKAYGSKQEYETAAKYFVIALDKDTSGKVLKEMKETTEFYWPVLFNAGTGFLKNKDSKERKNDYESWLNKAEAVFDTSVNYDYLVLLYAETGDEAKMVETISKATAKNPKNLSLYFNVAKFYIGEEKFDDAKSYLQKAIEIDPTNTQIIYWMGEINYSTKKFDDAITFYKKFFDAYQAEDSLAKTRLDSYRGDASFKMGKIYLEEKKKFADAINLFKTALSINSEDLESMLNLGFSYYKNKNYADAITIFDDYMKKANVEISALYYMKADCYTRLKKDNEAIKAYDKAKELEKQGK
ncbi:MAG: tetratricopeptide repeat protein [bacterium]|nr:tetratricopeptide repeat protein [bacterium]